MIYARLAPEQKVKQASQPHLAEMAKEGLMTLCLCQRDVSDREFQVCFSCLGSTFQPELSIWLLAQAFIWTCTKPRMSAAAKVRTCFWQGRCTLMS